MRIWELNTLYIGFSSYHLPESGKDEWFVEFMSNIGDEQKPIEGWEPLVLLKQEQRVDSDFFDIYDTGAVIVSKQGAVIFEAFCDPDDFQLLPFLNDERELFLFNLITPTDCLNKERPVFEALENGLSSSTSNICRRSPVFGTHSADCSDAPGRETT